MRKSSFRPVRVRGRKLRISSSVLPDTISYRRSEFQWLMRINKFTTNRDSDATENEI